MEEEFRKKVDKVSELALEAKKIDQEKKHAKMLKNLNECKKHNGHSGLQMSD